MNAIRTLTAREIECRISQVKKTWLQLLLYKDARCDMAILDETFGPMNWQRHHSRDNANCIVAIWDAEKQQWIEKEDTGTESFTEAEKGLASDSFKRACVNVGIGRELYTAPFIRITAPNCEIKESEKKPGNYVSFDYFEVSEIGYNDHREINHLVIVNSKTKAVVYSYDSGEPVITAKPKDGPAKSEDKPITDMKVCCERCGRPITGVALSNGNTMKSGEVIARSKLEYNGVYCYGCTLELDKKRKAG